MSAPTSLDVSKFFIKLILEVNTYKHEHPCRRVVTSTFLNIHDVCDLKEPESNVNSFPDADSGVTMDIRAQAPMLNITKVSPIAYEG